MLLIVQQEEFCFFPRFWPDLYLLRTMVSTRSVYDTYPEECTYGLRYTIKLNPPLALPSGSAPPLALRKRKQYVNIRTCSGMLRYDNGNYKMHEYIAEGNTWYFKLQAGVPAPGASQASTYTILQPSLHST